MPRAKKAVATPPPAKIIVPKAPRPQFELTLSTGGKCILSAPTQADAKAEVERTVQLKVTRIRELPLG